MFINNMLASIKMMIRQRDVLMWLVFFPIILATVFYFAFGGLSQTEVFFKADIAVANLETNPVFSDVLSKMSDSGGIFNVTVVTESEGRELVKEEKADALILVDGDEIVLMVSGMNINSTIVKTFLDTYKSNVQTVSALGSTPEDIEAIISTLNLEVEIINREISKNAVQQNTTYFYALFGMIIFFFNIVGMEIIKLSQPRKSPEAARQNLSPTSRKKILLTHYTGMFICCIFIVLLSIFFIGVVLGIPLGNIGFIFIACLIGTLCSIGFGMVLGLLPIKNQTIKDLVAMLLTLALSFLTGLMGAEIKEAITNNVPFLNYINPVALITDSFHSLYFYDGLGEFLLRIGLLGAYAALFMGITVFVIRRKKYAYI